MSKRKQCFDKLLEDYNCPDDAGPLSSEAKKKSKVRRSEKPKKNFAPDKAGCRSCDKSTSDESETECGDSKAQPVMVFYSVDDLRLAAQLRHEDQPRKEPVDEANPKAKGLFKEV